MSGKQIWVETQPVTENIMNIDLVWKPSNFQKSSGFEMMSKRCFLKPDKPFAYNHFEKIRVLTTKAGLTEQLSSYYSKCPLFTECGYSIEQSQALSFIIQPNDYAENVELQLLRKQFQRFEKGNVFDQRLTGRQLTKNLWIVKPDNENRGRGIDLASTWKELVQVIFSKQKTERVVV